MPDTEILLKLNISPLISKRDIADLFLFYKCITIHEMYKVDVTRYVSFASNSTNVHTRSTADHNSLKVPICQSYCKVNLIHEVFQILKNDQYLGSYSLFRGSAPILF